MRIFCSKIIPVQIQTVTRMEVHVLMENASVMLDIPANSAGVSI